MIHIGKPLPRAEIDARAHDARALMAWLRERTYALSPRPPVDLSDGLCLG